MLVGGGLDLGLRKGIGIRLARIIHIFEDNKSLLCYKHVD
jgi:hypothetical protein